LAQTSSGLNETPRHGFIKTFLNSVIITAHLRPSRNDANRGYSCCR
jgi:hypothetical protein